MTNRDLEIVALRYRTIGFSTTPGTLRSNLITNTSVFEDFATRPGGWFGSSFCTLIEIQTHGGHVGIGTAGAFNGAAGTVIEEYLAPLVLGSRVDQHELMWQRMYRSTVRFGRRGPAVAGLSGVDIAAWDAHAKAAGVSVTDLLGGQAQSSIPCYVSRLYALDDLEQLADEARGYLDEGFTRLKQRFGFGPKDGRAGMQRNVDLIAAVRQAVGPDVELAADAYMGWDRNYALDMAVRLREFDLAWIEEPLMPHEIDSYADLRARAPWQKWSCGEHSYTKWDMAELIRRGATDILQPDINRAGGLTEGRKIAALAEVSGIPLVPHSNEPHNLALSFSQVGHVCPVIEYFPDVEPDTGNELFWKLFDGVPTAEAGYLRMPEGRTGLGVSINEETAERLTLRDSGWIRP